VAPSASSATRESPGSLTVYERFTEYKPREDGHPDWTAGPKVAYLDRVEWHVLPDAATTAAALRRGEIDWWEAPLPDLLLMLSQDRNLTVRVLDPTGYIGCMRFNHLHPPFNNPAIRRALLGAVSQAEFMQAALGEDRHMWKDGVGIFCPDTPMANKAGLEVLTSPRDLSHAREAIRAAGYEGYKVVQLAASDIAFLNSVGEVTADLLRRLGFTVDYQLSDWPTLVQRRAKKDPPDRGGWNLFSNATAGLDQITPMTHLYLISNGMDGVPGWPTSARIEELRMRWLDEPDQSERRHVAEEIQRQAFQDVPYIPLGQYVNATAHRRNLTGMMNGFPVFWNLRLD
jgi:peptide/nickel transport system substrate-binding protein